MPRLIPLQLYLVLAAFSACTPVWGLPASPTLADAQLSNQTPLPTRVTSTAALTSSPTAISTPIITTTPLERVKPPAGIVYRLGSKLYRIGLAEEAQVVETQVDVPENGILSPNREYILITNSVSQMVIYRQAGSQVQVWPQNDINLCPFSWVPGQPALLLTVLLPEEFEPGLLCNRGSPVMLSPDGKRLNIPDITASGLSGPAVSADGRFLAYEVGGVPWLLEIGQPPAHFPDNRYGLDSLEGFFFADPAWSPSGRFLAWTMIDPNEKARQGIIMFELNSNKAWQFMPYEVSQIEGLRPKIIFSPNEEFLVFRHFIGEEKDWASHILSIGGQFSRRLDGYFASWSPLGYHFTMETRPGQDDCRIFVESPDGSLSIPICYGDWAIWSPDGLQVLTHTYNRDAFWLTELATRTTWQVDIPPGAEIINWAGASTATFP